jgi:low temperature requirement protein LtrA
VGKKTALHRSVRPVAEHDRVTTLELFFDLVFVFALTQISALVAGNLTPEGAARGLVLLGLLWWAWTAFTWLGNVARADVGVVRAGLIVAMGLVFAMGLAIPTAWDASGEGLSSALVFAAAYVLTRLVHVAVYWVAAGHDAGLRRQVSRLALAGVLPTVLLVSGALQGGATQTLLWAAALVADYVGVYLAGSRGWVVRSPGHFAERHGLIIIIALGESIVAIGVGVAELPVTAAILLASAFGLAVVVCLWWIYFDVTALAAERMFDRAEGDGRTRIARDGYTYLHFPMLVGIVWAAVGMKKVMAYTADTAAHGFDYPLPTWARLGLFLGPALYLLAHALFRRRLARSWSVPRLTVAALLAVLAFALAPLGALADLAVLALVLGALVVWEVVAMREVRQKVRQHVAHPHPEGG